VIGADGANSAVRERLGLGFEGRSYSEAWLIVDARNVSDPIDHVEFLCDPARPAPHMVAPGGRQRWEFMLRSDETPEEMERPERVRELLAPGGAPHPRSLKHLSPRVSGRFAAASVRA
jgi:3-(3-hydroxy-phenyl)propionate hydroxylase